MQSIQQDGETFVKNVCNITNLKLRFNYK